MKPKMTYGYMPSSTGGYWTIGEETERGTISKPQGIFGSAEDAKSALEKLWTKA